MNREIEYYYTSFNWFHNLAGFTSTINSETQKPFTSLEEVEEYIKKIKATPSPIADQFRYEVGLKYKV